MRSSSISGPDEAAAEALVDRGQHDVLHRRADVDPPVGDRPVDLVAVLVDLVGLLVAAVVDRLADARDELRRALADPRAEVVLVPLLAADPRHLATGARVGDDDEPLALAEPRRRRPLREAGDALDDVTVDAALLEPAHRPALHHDLVELHGLGLPRIDARRGWVRR